MLLAIAREYGCWNPSLLTSHLPAGTLNDMVADFIARRKAAQAASMPMKQI